MATWGGQLYKAGLRAYHALLDRKGCATCLEWLAVVAAAERRPARAARLFGAAHVLHETTGTSPDDVVRTIFDRAVVDVRAALGEEDWAAAWAAGRAMELEEAIAYALEEDQ